MENASSKEGDGQRVGIAEIENALVRAVLSGDDKLAQTLRVVLDKRQREEGGKVVSIKRRTPT